MKRIAIIPARGGSKRIPKKNIKNFLGVPIIQRTINILKETEFFDDIVVSTDDKRISEISIEAGAKVPFLRPSTLSDDQTPTAPVIKHTLDTLEESGIVYDYCCCVYPCNPFLTKKDLIDSFSELVSKNENFCFTVAEYHHPTQRRLRRLKSGLMQFLEPDHELTLTQSLEVHYHDAGQFYWGTDIAWKSGLKMHSDGVGFEIPNWRVVDIDTNNDWIRAENLFKIIEGKE